MSLINIYKYLYSCPSMIKLYNKGQSLVYISFPNFVIFPRPNEELRHNYLCSQQTTLKLKPTKQHNLIYFYSYYIYLWILMLFWLSNYFNYYKPYNHSVVKIIKIKKYQQQLQCTKQIHKVYTFSIKWLMHIHTAASVHGRVVIESKCQEDFISIKNWKIIFLSVWTIFKMETGLRHFYNTINPTWSSIMRWTTYNV